MDEVLAQPVVRDLLKHVVEAGLPMPDGAARGLTWAPCFYVTWGGVFEVWVSEWDRSCSIRNLTKARRWARDDYPTPAAAMAALRSLLPRA
jgi:hypothetical protein